MPHRWTAARMSQIDASGIRKVFDLAATMQDPVDLSIGQPDFDVPDQVKEAAIDAIRAGKNGYTVTQGIPALVESLRHLIRQRYPDGDREVMVTSGTSGGLVLALQTMVNPGEEVIVFDPYFVMYAHLVRLVGGVPIFVDTYPAFEIQMDRVEAATSARTKMVIVNSPANPTGSIASQESLRSLAEYCARRQIALLSDEVYSCFCHGSVFHSPAQWNPEAIVVDGFSKAYGMTGWRLGYVHGPAGLIHEMAKLQQFTFVCAPHPVQYGGIAALECDVSGMAQVYRRRRDTLLQALEGSYEIAGAQGAFYLFPRVPWGTGTEFVTEAIRRGLLVIPGNVFSRQDTHFRISYAASQRTIERGIEILLQMAKAP